MTSTARQGLAPPTPVDIAVELHAELLEIPVVTRASFWTSGGIGTKLQLDTSHRSISQLSKTGGTQTLVLSDDNTELSRSRLTFKSPDILHESPCLNGTRFAIFRSIAPKDNGKKVLLIEIWNSHHGNKEEEIEVGEKHGDWYFDETFGYPAWSPDGTTLVYTAEALAPTDKSEKFSFASDFGEKFTGRKSPCLFLLVLRLSSFNFEHIPKSTTLHQLTDATTFPSTSFGQAVFLPSLRPRPNDQPTLIATGYSSLGDARKLGVVYCTNRPTAIFELVLTASNNTWRVLNATQQSPEGISARSPRVFNNTDDYYIVFISNPTGGAHNSCASLHAFSHKSGKMTVVVDSVARPKTPLDFPGLYLDQLPAVPFLYIEGNLCVVLTSIWGSRKVPLKITLKTGEVENLLPWATASQDPVLPYLGNDKKGGLESIAVLTTNWIDRVVGLRSSLTKPAEVVVARFGGGRKCVWKVVKSPQLSIEVSRALEKLDWTILPLPKFEPTEVILISPVKIDPAAETRRNLPPLISIPHGGPHGTYTTDFSAQFVALALAGYRVALINYPGSLGFGQDFVEVLAPQLGTLDVEATLATSHFLNTISLASRTKGKKLLMGGSHGGFISAHLTSKYPDEFDACVMRNPVTDLPSMLCATDIPDWVYAEAALPYSLDKPPSVLTPATFAHLHKLSPQTKVADVTTPTLLLIGADDRRVPPDQGRNWYHSLKGNKVETEMAVFKGNGHALDSDVETELVGFEMGLRWLAKHTDFN